MGSVIASEGHQNHEDNRQNCKGQNAEDGKGQQGLVELIVHERAQVILAAFDLFALGSDVHADPALLDLQPPGVNERDDKQNGQQAVKHDLDGVVTGVPDLSVENGVVGAAALYRTDGRTFLEPLALLQPVDAAAGNQHIGDKDKLKQKEKQTTHDLAVVEVTEAKDEKGQLDSPVALGESRSDVDEEVNEAASDFFEKAENAASQL